ncbi:MAG TPA: DUF86 domain-containing protein [Candidatus Atribacteria bacterium]|nr:DUF86 domain-containing protein [Candidatus Atribacteria bacterium]
MTDFTVNYTQNLANMAKFRNLLVHLYWKVDDERLYQILQSQLPYLTLLLTV